MFGFRALSFGGGPSGSEKGLGGSEGITHGHLSKSSGVWYGEGQGDAVFSWLCTFVFMPLLAHSRVNMAEATHVLLLSAAP